MGVDLVVIAIEQIETLLLWNALGANISHAPFTESAGTVAHLLQYLGHGDVISE